MFYSDLAPSTRTRTPEGMLRASAIITRSGVFDYNGSDFQRGDSMIKVNRTRDTIADPETLSSIRGAPVTLDHPPGQKVLPDTWADQVVGSVVGEPMIDKDGFVRADILIGRQDAIEAIEKGTHELSIGYEFAVRDADPGSEFDLLTDGGLRVNHVAVVERGRAGGNVRILDSAMPSKQRSKSVPDDIGKQIRAAVDAALAEHKVSIPASANDAVAAKLDSVVRGLNEVKERQQASDEAAAKAAAEAQAKDAADKLVKATLAQADAYWMTMMDVLPMVPEAKRAKFAGKPSSEVSARDVMVAALEDKLPGAAAMDEAGLRGAMAMLKAQGLPGAVRPAVDAAGAPAPTDLSHFRQQLIAEKAAAGGSAMGQPIIPEGVGIAKVHSQDAASKARDEYVQRMGNAWMAGDSTPDPAKQKGAA